MEKLTRRIVEDLRSKDLTRDLDIIYTASEIARGFTNEEVTLQDLEDLEESFVVALERYGNQDEPSVVSALLFALSKTGKAEYKKIYQEHLRKGLESFLSYNQIVFHTLLALSDCDDEIAVLDWTQDPQGTSHASIGFDEHDKIAFLARQYLKSISKDLV